ncbi:hypothetical protein [Halodesulfovibrio marinisediminis]|uniref:Uncharacterized protein n=1 Tax=Halodesulfovibrio marinisediminis DSM 17456 TaxID=1121457 RepID=A0A1N6JAB5_9BACT|nr:hypothetical protein [Halodesulfovibrio marinisediminis]SIO41205.1 hypothetical protein SAMN02745161_3278 [Halodesulfovibrio marinisediminis DSM 17456]
MIDKMKDAFLQAAVRAEQYLSSEKELLYGVSLIIAGTCFGCGVGDVQSLVAGSGCSLLVNMVSNEKSYGYEHVAQKLTTDVVERKISEKELLDALELLYSVLMQSGALADNEPNVLKVKGIIEKIFSNNEKNQELVDSVCLQLEKGTIITRSTLREIEIALGVTKESTIYKKIEAYNKLPRRPGQAALIWEYLAKTGIINDLQGMVA